MCGDPPPLPLTLHGFDEDFFSLFPHSVQYRARVRVRVRARAQSKVTTKVASQSGVVNVLMFIENNLFPVPVELLDKLLQSLRTPGADGAVIDPEHLQRRLPRRLALTEDFLDNVK